MKIMIQALWIAVMAVGTACAEVAVKTETAVFGGGCFWCIEAVFQQVDGVVSVRSGYMGGRVKNPSYKDVSAGDSGHAEVVQVQYDPSRVSYPQLLEWFWRAHDPTQLNRQGADEGEQYRTVIFYEGEAQKAAAEKSKTELEKSGELGQPVVTQIVPVSEFYPAENYHQDYYSENRSAPYCQFVIRPKLKKLGLKP